MSKKPRHFRVEQKPFGYAALKTSNSRVAVPTSDIPTPEDAKGLSDGQLIDKLRALGVEIDRESMSELCDSVVRIQKLSEIFEAKFMEHNPDSDLDFEIDWLWICLNELWHRWFPDKPCYEIWDTNVDDGYDLIDKDDILSALERWRAAWICAAKIMDKCDISIERFDRGYFYNLENWLQDYRMHLWNAGLDNEAFHNERVNLCEEILKRTEKDYTSLTVQIARSDMAESMFELGRSEEAEQLFETWLREDPQWGWGWIYWSRCYLRLQRGEDETNAQRAEEILKQGLAVAEVRDRFDIIEALAQMLDHKGKEEEAEEYWKQLESAAKISHVSILAKTPIAGQSEHDLAYSYVCKQLLSAFSERNPEKEQNAVGRKEPCPCGSGKKYKRCCGS